MPSRELLPYLGVLWASLHFWGVVGAAAAWSLRVAADAILLFWLASVRSHALWALGPSALLFALMGAILFSPVADSHWRWTLGVAVLLASMAWSWRCERSTVRRLIRVPAAVAP